jgi:serine/threonine protein kinase/tetratricopeptide (TPR) repeat protein
MNDQGQQRVGFYTLEGKIGEGGMGVVYRARDERLGREVAVKLLKPELVIDQSRIHRFKTEARAMATVSHPNIVVIHDVGTWCGRPFIVTELLDGESLKQRMLSGALAVSKALEYAAGVTHALEAAHDRGVVHRDLKSENVFLTSDGRVKILDFGIAALAASTARRGGEADSRDVGREDTHPGDVAGTPCCMSPEQIRGLPVDHRTDIFAVGVMLFEMLTGRRPFAGETPGETMAMILHDDPPRLGWRVPDALAQIVWRCLEKRPKDRFSSAHDLRLALDAFSNSVSLERTTSFRRLTRIISEVPGRSRQRGARLAVVAAIVALALLGFRIMLGTSGGESPSADLIPHRIAVVPFVCAANCGGDEPLGMLAAMHLARALATLEEVEVVRAEELSAYPVTSLLEVERIAAATNAGLVLSGGWHRQGEEVEFSATLEEAASGRIVGVFGPVSTGREALGPALRVLSDQALIAVQDELHPSLAFGAGERWPRIDAYREFRASLEIAGAAPLEAAFARVERALELDPDFMRPRLVWSGALTFVRPKVVEQEVALADLAKLLPKNRLRLSLQQERILDGILFRIDGNWRGASQVFQEVLERDPRNCISRLYVIDSAVRANRPHQAIAAFDGMVWDPIQPQQPKEIAFTGAARAYHLVGQHDDELEAIERLGPTTQRISDRLWVSGHRLAALAAAGDIELLELSIQDALLEPALVPFHHAQILIAAAVELREHGHSDAAISVAERTLDELRRSEISESHPDTFLELWSDAMYLTGRADDAYQVVLDAVHGLPDSFDRSKVIGLAAARAGDRDAAYTQMFTLAQTRAHRVFGESDFLRARIAAQLGDREEALRLLRRAIVNGFWDYPALRCCPDLQPLREDPEFRRLVEPKG